MLRPPLLIFFSAVLCHAADLDLSKATLVVDANASPRDRKAAQVLVEEVEKRAQIRWKPAAPPAGSHAPYVELKRSGKGAAESYEIRTQPSGVTVTGADERGLLFGVGRLLRQMRMTPGRISVPDGFSAAAAPKYPLRGHQLGYRPKTNSYDGWSVPVWDQYIRDLAIFGTNAIELLPPRTDDAATSPHFPLPQMDMMIEMSRILDQYGLDVWIWYPAMDKDYSDPKTVEFALNEWEQVYKRLPRIDAIFVPGGDPGHTQPKYLLALLEKQTRVLHKYHPKAQMWVSPQSFSGAWLAEFYDILNKQQPAWLTGVVFGPQISASLPALRAAIPKKYPIRHYPDITHSRQCQYPVPDWDVAYAVTEGREIINPRPLDQARIFRLLQPYTNGFITYSEGCNDDVNKFIWSALGWDPDADVTQVLREFSRYFIGERYTDDFAQGLLALERNWRGPLLTNQQVYSTLQQFQSMERAAAPAVTANWRFQQALYRAYYDAYTRRRLLYESAAEESAMDRLRAARLPGAVVAMSEAEAILDRPSRDHVAADWRARVFELAEALYQSIRMQLSVERYRAISTDRGATLDTIDFPLNSKLWLKQRFEEIRKLDSEPARLAALREIADWTDPGPGGFYDDLGNLTAQPHLERGLGVEKDPAFLESTLVGFSARGPYRTSFWTHAEALSESPLRMRYTELDPAAAYKVRVVYAGDSPRSKIRMLANDRTEIHPYLEKPNPYRPLEFDIPRQETQSGKLTLTWYREPGMGGNGRGNQVSEVWLMKK
jgi:hypothetical protein